MAQKLFTNKKINAMTNEQIELATIRKRNNEKRVKDEMEKVEIATLLCHSCSVEQMRYLMSHAKIIIKKLRMV